jgi:CcmD family protein
MFGDDKLFVVIIVMSIIFLGFGFYLFTIDRKLSKIEKKQRELSEQKNNGE